MYRNQEKEDGLKAKKTQKNRLNRDTRTPGWGGPPGKDFFRKKRGMFKGKTLIHLGVHSAIEKLEIKADFAHEKQNRKKRSDALQLRFDNEQCSAAKNGASLFQNRSTTGKIGEQLGLACFPAEKKRKGVRGYRIGGKRGCGVCKAGGSPMLGKNAKSYRLGKKHRGGTTAESCLAGIKKKAKGVYLGGKSASCVKGKRGASLVSPD